MFAEAFTHFRFLLSVDVFEVLFTSFIFSIYLEMCCIRSFNVIHSWLTFLNRFHCEQALARSFIQVIVCARQLSRVSSQIFISVSCYLIHFSICNLVVCH